MKPRVLILRAAGTNCDTETETAFRWAGAQTARIHINEFLRGRAKLADHDILCLPGGFSYGDHIAAGRLLAHEFSRLQGLAAFIQAGKPVLGICNGFQVLVKSGVLPGGKPGAPQTVSLGRNTSGRFECTWARVKVERLSFMLDKLPDELELPVAHAEGRFLAPDDVLKKVEKQVALRYLDNISGSMRDVAGLCNAKGNVLGLMPHPERFLTPLHHPTRRQIKAQELGLQVFRNCVDHVKG